MQESEKENNYIHGPPFPDGAKSKVNKAQNTIGRYQPNPLKRPRSLSSASHSSLSHSPRSSRRAQRLTTLTNFPTLSVRSSSRSETLASSRSRTCIHA